MPVRKGLSRVLSGIGRMDTLDVVTRLTLVLFLYSEWVVGPAASEWTYRLPLRALAITGLLVPPLHRSRLLWGLATAILALKSIVNWSIQDNHLFVDTYWCGAILLAICSASPCRVLADNARLLIGISFALAVLWKAVLSGEFMSGDYFHFTLLTDSRFRDLTVLAGGIGETMIQANHAAMGRLTDPTAGVEAVRLQSTLAIAVLAQVMTWYTLAIELLVAVAFLWPARRAIRRYRDACLLVFAWTVYLVVSVHTFGWTLMAMGFAQCEPRRRITRLLYLVGLAVVLIYEFVPLLGLIRRLSGR